jgi:hypothetical protein
MSQFWMPNRTIFILLYFGDVTPGPGILVVWLPKLQVLRSRREDQAAADRETPCFCPKETKGPLAQDPMYGYQAGGPMAQVPFRASCILIGFTGGRGSFQHQPVARSVSIPQHGQPRAGYLIASYRSCGCSSQGSKPSTCQSPTAASEDKPATATKFSLGPKPPGGREMGPAACRAGTQPSAHTAGPCQGHATERWARSRVACN